MSAQLAIGQSVLAGLSEGQRPIAHLVLLLGVLAGAAVVGLVYLVRRTARRPDPTEEHELPEER